MGVRIICKAIGCCNLVDKYSRHKYCEEHRLLEEKEEEKKQRMPYASAQHNRWQNLYGSAKWKKLKQAQLERQSQCEVCGDTATEVHHVIAHNGVEDLFYDPNNLQSLCHTCHLRATQRESWDRRRAVEQEKKPQKLWY